MMSTESESKPAESEFHYADFADEFFEIDDCSFMVHTTVKLFYKKLVFKKPVLNSLKS